MTLYRKYRPQKFSQVIGQDHIRDTLIQAIIDDKLSQAYLFSGPRGTGKTSTARLIAKVANCLEIEKQRAKGEIKDGEPCGKCQNCLDISEGKSLDIIEVDAASNRGIDEIRQLRDQVKFSPIKGKFKIYIIDEVHMLTREAFNALLKTLEEPPAHVIFILATTEPHKVLPTIISRTQRFDFGRISIKHLTGNLESIAKKEGIKADQSALEIIASLSEGAGRDSLSMLEQVASYSNNITVEVVNSVLGLAETDQVLKLVGAIFNSKSEEGLKIAQALYQSGSNIAELNLSILNILRKILNWLVVGDFLIDDTQENKKNIISLCQLAQKNLGANYTADMLKVIKEFLDCNKLIKETADPLIALEVAIVGAVQYLNKSVNTSASKTENLKLEANSNQIEKNSLEVSKEISKEKSEGITLNQKSGAIKNNDSSQVESNLALNPLNELSEELWAQVVGELKKENTTLAALLRDAKPVAITKGKVVLGVRFKFHKDKISEAKNISLLEGVICSVTNSSCRISCEIMDFKSKTQKSASEDELAEEAEKIFGE